MTGRAAYEHVERSPGASWRLLRVRGPEVPFSWHFHPEVEVSLIVRGTGTRFVGDSITSYQPGQLVLIGPDVPHAFVSTPGSAQDAVVLQFRSDFLGDGLFGHTEFAPIAVILERSKRGLAFDSNIAVPMLLGLEALPPARRTLRLLEVLLELAERPDGEALASESHNPRLDRAGAARVNAILRLLHARHAEPVTLAEVAAAAHMAPAATSRFFRRATGSTITAYLNMVRVSVACRLLIETELSITEVAVESGYQNLSHFNRQFLRLKGVPPRAYRSRFRH